MYTMNHLRSTFIIIFLLTFFSHYTRSSYLSGYIPEILKLSHYSNSNTVEYRELETSFTRLDHDRDPPAEPALESLAQKRINPDLIDSDTLRNVDTPKNILVWPAEWSHWLNMKIIIDNLKDKRNHKITVIRPALYTDFIKNSTKYDIIDLPTPGYLPNFHMEHLRNIIEIFKLGNDQHSVFKKAKSMVQFWLTHIFQRRDTCEMLFKNEHGILEQLKSQSFDVVIADPCVICGEMLSIYLGVPLIHNVRMLPGEIHQTVAGAPLPASYVPIINTEFTDDMKFFDRLVNYVNLVVQQFMTKLGLKIFADPLIEKYLVNNRESVTKVESGTTMVDLQSRAALWLIRLDFTFEFPRPLMPNMKYIGGFHARPANFSKIPNEILDFIDTAEKGVVVFSMGSMVDQIGSNKAEIIAKAISNIELGYKVIWRYNHKTEIGLPKGLDTRKVLVLPWLPQNDLLGHPKVKLFITHGGTNGLYEAIYHGVPVLGLPLLVDQFDNLVRIERWNAGRHFDVTTLKSLSDSKLLTNSINFCLNNENLSQNMINFSNIHKYRLNDPLDEINFWIEYVINTKGAKHLRSKANDLSFIAYHLLDVYVFLVGCGFVAFYLVKRIISGPGRPTKKTKMD